VIAAWMAYSAATAAMLALAAWLAERGFLGARLPTRWLWIVAFGGSLGACAAGWLLPDRVVPGSDSAATAAHTPASGVDGRRDTGADAAWEMERSAAAAVPGSEAAPAHDDASRDALGHTASSFDDALATVERGGEAGSLRAGVRRALAPMHSAAARWSATVARDARIDRMLAVLWLLASLLLLVRIGRSHGKLRRLHRSWRAETVDGVRVLVSRQEGPAVIGFRPGRVVLPEWALRIGGERRALLLAHELEHLRAGDHRLLTAADLMLAMVPWNLPLWWQLRRLRHAVELDCDARVLRRQGSAEAYGSLLVDVALRRSPRLLPGTSFVVPASYLERRVRALLRGGRAPGWRAGLGVRALAAFGVVVMAAAVPRPAVLPEGDGDGPVGLELRGGPETAFPERRLIPPPAETLPAPPDAASSSVASDFEPLPSDSVPRPDTPAPVPLPYAEPGNRDSTLLGYSTRPGHPALPLRYDSAGVEIVETVQPAWDGGQPWTLSREPLVSIGRAPEDGKAPDVFADVTGALRLPDGQIVVADGAAGEIRFFDASGRFVRAAGGIGDGPDRFEPGGEFRRSPHELRQCGDGRIYAIEPHRRRVSVWNERGAFQRTFDFLDPEVPRGSGPAVPQAPEPVDRYPYGWACTADGGFVVGSWSWSEEEDPRRIGPSLYEARASVWRLDSIGQPAVDLGEHLLAERVALSTPEKSWTDAPHPLGRSVVFAGDGERTYVSTGEGLSIRVYGQTGTPVRVLRAPAGDVAITEAILEKARGTGPGWSRREIFLKADSLGIPLPAALPGATHILLDPARNVWVRRFQLPWEARERWGVFAADGLFLGHLQMPAGLAVQEVAEDRVLGVHTDALGVERVHLYGLNRTSGSSRPYPGGER